MTERQEKGWTCLKGKQPAGQIDFAEGSVRRKTLALAAPMLIAQVLNLLNDLKEDFGFTYLFISHDLSVVQYMSDHLAVMQGGRIVEYGRTDVVYKNPQSSYTQRLMDAIPRVRVE